MGLTIKSNEHGHLANAGSSAAGQLSEGGSIFAHTAHSLARAEATPTSRLTGLPSEVKSVITAFLSGDLKTLGRLSCVSRDWKEFMTPVTSAMSDAYKTGVVRKDFENSKPVMVALVTRDGNSLPSVPKQLQDDRDVVSAALEKTPSSFSYASDRLKDDFDLVLRAVALDWLNLLSASDRLSNDREVVMKAMEKEPLAFASAGEWARADFDIALFAVKKNFENFRHVDAQLATDPKFFGLVYEHYTRLGIPFSPNGTA